VAQSAGTLETFTSDPQMTAFHSLAARAKGIFVAPQVLNAAVVVGASSGDGVLVVRDEKTRTWHGPAFYSVWGASLGLQVGAEASEVVVLVMTQRGVTAMLKPGVRFGVDASIAVGPMGGSIGGATANASVDLVAFARSKGLFGGVSLKGAVVAVQAELNEAYYGHPTTPADIVIRGGGANLQAEQFLAAVQRVTRGSPVSDAKAGPASPDSGPRP
jgi:SH3 domain-containing YSC84-like protein 1